MTPCGSTNTEVYAFRDCGDRYITNEDTSIWDPGSTETIVVIDIVARIGYRMICSGIQQYAVVCSGIQCYAEGYSGTQWETMELRGDSYSHLMEHGWSRRGRSALLQQYMDSRGRTLSSSSVFDYGGSMVDHLCEETPLEACDGMGVAWMSSDYSDSPLAHRDEFHGEVHSSKIDLRLEYHLGWDSEQDSHVTILRYPYEFLVMPLGLTNAPTTYQIFLQLHRCLFLFFDSLSIYNKTWEDPLR